MDNKLFYFVQIKNDLTGSYGIFFYVKIMKKREYDGYLIKILNRNFGVEYQNFHHGYITPEEAANQEFMENLIINVINSKVKESRDLQVYQITESEYNFLKEEI